MIEAYLANILILICIYIILTVSLNIAVGYTGLLNLGHVAFFGIGAYASSILAKQGFAYGWSFLAAGIIAAIAGFLLVYGIRKLKGDYLALATLGFTFVTYSLMLNWTSLTRGALGIAGIPRPCFFSVCTNTLYSYLLFTVIVALICVLVMFFITKSPFGRLLQATRDDELGLRVLGKNTFKLKAKSMMISAFFAGIAGSIFAHYIRFIDPSAFTFQEVILLFTILIVGGLASIKGSIIASFVILIIPELLRFLYIPSSVLGPARQIIYAVILIAIIMYKPKGFFGRVDLE